MGVVMDGYVHHLARPGVYELSSPLCHVQWDNVM